MNDSALSRFAPRVAPPSQSGDADAEEDLGTVGILRGARERALYLEFRRKEGSVEALSYALLDRATLNPSGEITLRFTQQEVRIVGQRLNAPIGSGGSLFSAILRHRAVWVRESNRADALAANGGGPVIEAIEIR